MFILLFEIRCAELLLYTIDLQCPTENINVWGSYGLCLCGTFWSQKAYYNRDHDYFVFQVIYCIFLFIGALRIGKIVPNPFSESAGEMKQWHHVDCIFDVFKRARATTKKIEDPIEDIDGWEEVEDDDKKKIRALIDGV